MGIATNLYIYIYIYRHIYIYNEDIMEIRIMRENKVRLEWGKYFCLISGLIRYSWSIKWYEDKRSWAWLRSSNLKGWTSRNLSLRVLTNGHFGLSGYGNSCSKQMTSFGWRSLKLTILLKLLNIIPWNTAWPLADPREDWHALIILNQKPTSH